jgi:putative membrane protein
MGVELLLRYVHFICIFAIVSCLVAEHLLLKSTLLRKEIIRIGKIDGIYGLAVVVLLGAGFTLWMGGYGKPEEFYSNNPLFITKLVLFSAIGILSIYPTVFFMQKRKGDPEELIPIPAMLVWMIRLELLLVLIIPLLAGMMAKGIGLEG